jgi:hypothetical protein
MLLELITRQTPTGEMFKDGLNLRNWVGASSYFGCVHVVDAGMMWCYKEA